MFAYQTPEWIKQTRRKLELSQTQFWAPLCVTQSAGSRYESSRDVPDSVRMLLAIAYGTEPQRFEALKHASQRSSERVIISREVSGVTQRLTQRGGLYSLHLDDGKQRQVHSQDSVLRTLGNSWFKEALQGGEPAKPALVPTESAPPSGAVLVELPAENGHEAITVVWQRSNEYLRNDEKFPVTANEAIRWLGNALYNERCKAQTLGSKPVVQAQPQEIRYTMYEEPATEIDRVTEGGIPAGEMFVLGGGEKPEEVRYFVHGDLEVHRVTLRKTHYTAGHVSFEFAGVLLTYKNEDATKVLFENEDDARAQLQLNKTRYFVSEGGKITQVLFDGEDEDDVFFIADGFCHRIPKHAAAVKLFKSLGAAETAVAASRLLLG